MIVNGGFRTPYHEVAIETDEGTRITGEIADGWEDNSSWAHVVIEYSECAVNAHGGESCQRIAVKRISSGAAQFTQDAVNLQEGAGYRARVFARSQDGVFLRLQIRQPGSPYREYAGKVFRPGPDWTECELVFGSPVSGPALFMLIPQEVGTVDVEDASLVRTGPASDGPPKQANLLATGRMVGGAANGWDGASPWAASSPIRKSACPSSSTPSGSRTRHPRTPPSRSSTRRGC